MIYSGTKAAVDQMMVMALEWGPHQVGIHKCIGMGVVLCIQDRAIVYNHSFLCAEGTCTTMTRIPWKGFSMEYLY